MEYESSSRTVRGLSIATIVLSILGIVLALGLGACSSAVVNTVEDQLVEPIADEPLDFDGYMDEISDAVEEMTGASLIDLSVVIANNDVDQLHKLGAAIELGDSTKVEKILKGMAKEAGVSIDEQELALSIMSIGVDDTRELGRALQQVTQEDYIELIMLLDGNPVEFHHGAMNDSYSVGEIAGIARGTILAISWVLIFISILGCAVTLVAAILSMRNASNPNRLTGAFVWSIVGAAIALLSCRLVTMVLLIINCVYINKVRSFRTLPATAAAAAQAAPVPPFEQASQPVGAAPQHPAAEESAPSADNTAPVPPQE